MRVTGSLPVLSIQSVEALEILDSRGNPTLSALVTFSDGSTGTAQVPSGASTGKHEAVELRDADPARYRGKGVLKAVSNVRQVLGPGLIGKPVEDQASIDRWMIELDGTADKSRLGANAILGVSCAFARALAAHKRMPLWASLDFGVPPAMPLPMVNIISGGAHAGRRIEIQDFLIVPHGFDSMADRLEAVVACHHAAHDLLVQRGCHLTGVADEGGWGPELPSNEAALEVLAEVITSLGLEGRASIAIDVAASHFLKDGIYLLHSEDRKLERGEMIDLLATWVDRYPVISIEDGLGEDDWDGWITLTRRLGSRVRLIGDDLFTTNPHRVRRGIASGAANSVLVKMNQIGTLTETMEVARMAREAGYSLVISARSGETEDSFLADFAVASGAGEIKIGSITRSERLSKYNRLLEIEYGWKSGKTRPTL
jgi:enolase